MKRVIIWGTGGVLKTYLPKFGKIFDDSHFVLVGFIDSNPEKKGTILLEREICLPEEIGETDYDILVIAASKEKYGQMWEQAVNVYGMDESKIHSFTSGSYFKG